MQDPEAIQPVRIALAPVEFQFLLTVLRSSGALLTALMALQESLPGLPALPLTADAVIHIAALADKLAEQADDGERL
jgi:hypothetical protein